MIASFARLPRLITVALLALVVSLEAGCTAAPPSPLAVVDAAQTAYQLLAKDEKAAIDLGLIKGPAIALVHQTDNTLYSGLVAWRTAAENGQTVAVSTEAGVEATLKAFVAQLTAANALSPASGKAASDAIGLLQLLTGA